LGKNFCVTNKIYANIFFIKIQKELHLNYTSVIDIPRCIVSGSVSDLVIPALLSFPLFCHSRSFVISPLLSFPHFCHSHTFVIPTLLSFPHFCHSRECGNPQMFEDLIICDSKCFVIPAHLSFPHICHSRAFAIPALLSFPRMRESITCFRKITPVLFEQSIFCHNK